jgi:hypothetical protein
MVKISLLLYKNILFQRGKQVCLNKVVDCVFVSVDLKRFQIPLVQFRLSDYKLTCKLRQQSSFGCLVSCYANGASV